MTDRLYKNKTAFTTVDAVATIENSALRCAEEGDNEKAAHFFYAAAIEAEKHNIDPKHIIILWRDAGNCFYRSMKFVQGIKALENALAIAIKFNDKVQAFRIRLQIVGILHAAGDYEHSLEEIRNAYNIAEQLHDADLLIIAKSFYGTYYTHTKNSQLALKYQLEALRHCEKKDDERRIAGSHYNTGQAYVIALDSQNAEIHFRKALDYFTESKDDLYIMRCKCMLGGVLEGYHMNGVGTNRDEGIVLLKEALELCILQDLKYEEYGVRLMLADAYLRDCNDVLAEKELLVARELASHGGSRQNTLEFNKKLSEIAERRGNYTLSLDYLKQHIDVLTNDDIDRQKQNQIIFEIQLTRMEEKRKNEILEKELQIKQKVNEAVAIHMKENEKFLTKLHKRLIEIEPSVKIKSKKEIVTLKNEIKDILLSKKEWTEFENGFLQAHSELEQKLLNKYPSLTLTERKVCIFLHSGRSTKEIASLLHISPDTVDTHRINIRRKMNLQPRTSIRTVLASL